MLVRFLLALICVWSLGFVIPLANANQDDADKKPSVKKAGESKSKPNRLQKEGYRQQIFDEPLVILKPTKPRNTKTQAHVDAMAWFMTGRLRQSNNDLNSAFKAFKKAVEFDPGEIEIYRSLIPLAFELRRDDDGIKYAIKAIEIEPQNYRLLRQLGRHMAGQSKIPQAIQLMERAAKSPALRKDSGYYFVLIRDLGIMYGIVRQPEKAADSFEIVFDALLNKRKYRLSPRTVLELERNVSQTYEMIGQTFLAAKRIPLAIQALELAAKARKGKPGALSFYLAQAYFETKQHENALSHLQKYFDAQLQSKGRSAYQLLVEIYKAQGQTAKAIIELEKLAKKDPKNSSLQFFVAAQYLASDRLKDAETLYKKTLLDADDSIGFLGLVSVYRKMNEPENLLLNLAKVFSAPIDEPAKVQLELTAIQANEKLFESVIGEAQKLMEQNSSKFNYALSYRLANMTASSEEKDVAIKFYRYCLKKRTGVRGSALLYEEFGVFLLTNRKYPEAVKMYRDAANDRMDANIKSHFIWRLSQALQWDDKSEEALQVIVAARKTADAPNLHFQEGWLHYVNQRIEPAIKVFNGFIKKYEKQQDASTKDLMHRTLMSLSNCYVQQGEMGKGEEVLERIYKNNPDDISVCNDLGYLYADQGKKLKQAEMMIRKAVKAEPNNAAYLDSMGWVLFKLNKFQEAVVALEKASKLPAGADHTIWDHLGDCYDRLKQPKKATTAWKQALKYAEDSPRKDKKIISRIQQKLKNQKGSTNQVKPEKKGAE